MSRPFLILDGFHREISTSKAQYHLVDELIDSHDAVIVARTSSVSRTATYDFYTPPGGRYLQFLLFPLFTLFKFYHLHEEFDLLASNQRGEAILPALALSLLSDLNWIILSWDTPDGMHIMRRNFQRISLAYVVKELMFPLIKIGVKTADLTITTDESAFLDQFANDYAVFPGGVDCEKFNQIEPSRADGSDKIQIIYVGNMYYHRGIDIIFDAIENSEGDFVLDLVGPAETTENQYTTNLPAPIDEYVKRFDNVDYHGKLSHDETVEMIGQADIGVCLLPYSRGGHHFQRSYSIKVFEYMRAGLAVLATRTIALETVLSEEQLLDSDDPAEFSSKIDRLCDDERLLDEIKRKNESESQQYCWRNIREKIDVAVRSQRRGTAPPSNTKSL